MNMKKEFVKYLHQIGLSRTLVERVGEIYEWCEALCPDDIDGIFVGDFVSQEGRREYSSLWFFSEGHAMEAKGFVGRDDFDIMTLRDGVAYVQVKKTDYDSRPAGAASRLNVRFALENRVAYGEIKASGENCDFLMDVLKTYVLSNLTK